MARTLTHRLSDVGVMFVEEPVLPENIEHLPSIARQTRIPIAAGERLYSHWDYKRLFDTGAIDAIQPDVSHAGGISEMVKIANAAEARFVAVAPNCPLGPIALAASVQIDTVIPNFLVQDHGFDVHPGEQGPAYEYLADPSVFAFEDGYFDTLDDPGLGIEIDESAVEAHAEATGNWHNPVWRHEDGSVADW